jgi:ethanolamine ammonia-lyase small subunit
MPPSSCKNNEDLMDKKEIDIQAIVKEIMAELAQIGAIDPGQDNSSPVPEPNQPDIDLPDPSLPENRQKLGVTNPYDPEGLRNLCSTTGARLGVGRAGPRPRTETLLLFQADHAVTQDAIYGEVDQKVLEKFGLFTVHSQVDTRTQFLLRPDLGRLLNEESKAIIAERCEKNPQVQIVVGDGLSAAAINNNLPLIYPVIEEGLKAANFSLGTPFFIKNARVGIINDLNEIIKADVVVILIGERPGLGISDALSAYMGWQPAHGKTDADRDVVCMITMNGGTNTLEGGAFVVEMVKKTIKYQASGIALREKANETG